VPLMPALAVVGLLGRVSASARERRASVRGRAGQARESGCRRVELGHALSWVAPRNFTPSAALVVALDTAGGCTLS